MGAGDVNIKQLVSQDVNSKMGKILEISVSTHQVKMVSLGHRNPEGLIVTTNGDFVFDRARAVLVATSLI